MTVHTAKSIYIYDGITLRRKHTHATQSRGAKPFLYAKSPVLRRREISVRKGGGAREEKRVYARGGGGGGGG